MVTGAWSILVLLLLLASSAQAVPVEVNSRAALGGNDFIDWGTLGPEGTVLPNPFVAASNGGIGATVTQAGSAPFLRLDQGSDWGGNFAPGDALIFNLGSSDTIGVQFSTPVAGAGAQVQSAVFGVFQMTLLVFDSGNSLIGLFSEFGDSNSNADNSAIFLGVLNDTANIDRIQYILSFPDFLSEGGFAMNQLDLVTDGQLAPIPEPGTILLLATSLTGLGVAGWRKHVKRHIPEASSLC